MNVNWKKLLLLITIIFLLAEEMASRYLTLKLYMRMAIVIFIYVYLVFTCVLNF